MKAIGPDDMEYYQTFTVEQLRKLAASKSPSHIVYGAMAAAELLRRGESI
jgi:hypothetical protein